MDYYNDQKEKEYYTMTSPQPAKKGCITFSNQFYLYFSFAGTALCLFLFQIVFTMVLAYLFPSCFCADMFHHITILPANAAMLLFVLFLFFATLSIFGLLALYGVYKEKIAKIYPFLFLLVVVLVSMLIGGIIGGVKSISGGEAEAPVEVSFKEQQKEILSMLSLILTEDGLELVKSLMVLTDPQFVSMDVQKMMEKFLKPTALEFVEAGEKTLMVAAVITVVGVLIMLVGTIVCLWKLVQKMSEYQKAEANKRNQFSPDGYIMTHNNNTVSVRSRNHSQQNPKVEYRSSVYHSRHALSSHSEEILLNS